MYKYASRKFIACIAGVLVGISTAFGDASTVSTIAGAVVSVLSVVAYIVTEGRVDAASVALAVEDINAVMDCLEGDNGAETDG